VDSNAPQPITPAFGLVDPGQSRAAEKQKERWGGWWLYKHATPSGVSSDGSASL